MYKSASGCLEHLNIFEVSNINTTLKYLRDKNFWVYGFDASSEKDFIDINNKVESLNISNTASIVFHHINKQKKISW